METLHNTNPARNLLQVREKDRLILTLAGIVIALICSLVLLHDTNSIGRVATRSGLGEGFYEYRTRNIEHPMMIGSELKLRPRAGSFNTGPKFHKEIQNLAL